MSASEHVGPLRVCDDETLHSIFKLRAKTWSDENSCKTPMSIWHDQFDLTALHWAAWIDGNLVGAARVTIHESLTESPDAALFSQLKLDLVGRIASWNRLVVSPIARGRGLAQKFDKVRLEASLEAGADYVVGCAFERRARIVVRSGFEILGRCEAEFPIIGVERVCLLARDLRAKSP